jgi:hypothetical protein
VRALLLLALVVALIGSAIPARAGSLPPLLVSARLFAWDGHWHPVDWGRMVNSEPLRIDVQVSTPHIQATGISVRFALRHVTWPGSHPITQPADVQGRLRQTMLRGHMAHFQAILHVPVTHPLQFSSVIIQISKGRTARTVISGVTFVPPTTPAEAPIRLTVPQVFSFCAAQHGLPYLSYGVAVRAYVHGIPSGSDGPAEFIVLAHPTLTTNLTALTQHHEGFRANGFVSPSQNRLVTIAGSLACRPQVGFAIFGASK